MPDTVRNRYFPAFGYARIPCDPPPARLAQQLAEANVAKKAAERIDTYERFRHQHQEHVKQQLRTGLGMAGLFFSIMPVGPGLVRNCARGFEQDCVLSVFSILGATIAVGLTMWNSWDLYRSPSRFAEHVARLNGEIERAMHAKNGEARVTRLFDTYRSMSWQEQREFKAQLDTLARAPRTAEAAQRALENADSQLTLDDLQPAAL